MERVWLTVSRYTSQFYTLIAYRSYVHKVGPAHLAIPIMQTAQRIVNIQSLKIQKKKKQLQLPEKFTISDK